MEGETGSSNVAALMTECIPLSTISPLLDLQGGERSSSLTFNSFDFPASCHTAVDK